MNPLFNEKTLLENGFFDVCAREKEIAFKINGIKHKNTFGLIMTSAVNPDFCDFFLINYDNKEILHKDSCATIEDLQDCIELALLKI